MNFILLTSFCIMSPDNVSLRCHSCLIFCCAESQNAPQNLLVDEKLCLSFALDAIKYFRDEDFIYLFLHVFPFSFLKSLRLLERQEEWNVNDL